MLRAAHLLLERDELGEPGGLYSNAVMIFTTYAKRLTLSPHRSTQVRQLSQTKPWFPGLTLKLNLALRRGGNPKPIEILAMSRLLALDMGLGTERTVAFPAKKLAVRIVCCRQKVLARRTGTYLKSLILQEPAQKKVSPSSSLSTAARSVQAPGQSIEQSISPIWSPFALNSWTP